MFFYQDIVRFSSPVGTWTAGVPSEADFDVPLSNAKKVYKIISVIQPPFMQWNETLREETNLSRLFLLFKNIIL